MAFAKVHSAQVVMLDAHVIDIEVDLSLGLHSFTIVGLPDKAVEESRDRFAAAIKNSGFVSPKQKNQKVVVSLAPADLKKEGPNFDLGIALAYLHAAGDISFDPRATLFLGELSLDGSLRKVHGTLLLVSRAKEKGFTQVFLPEENAKEAALIEGIKIFAANSLLEVIDHLSARRTLASQPATDVTYRRPRYHIDFDDIRGQEGAKRGFEIAAAGGHNAALYGPPGTGKTLLSRAFTSILPPLNFDDILEVTGIHSVAGTLGEDVVTHPPLRAPHHTASPAALTGGGSIPKPGEVTLAHRGVLFLDEFPEFDQRVIEALRQPLEDNHVSISRARGSARFPANFILLAAMNPCPCGNFGSSKPCTCTPSAMERYSRKLSGPIIDRIDLWLEVAQVPHEKLLSKQSSTNKADSSIARRVAVARKKQEGRFAKFDAVTTNSDMGVKEIDACIHLSKDVEKLLATSARKLDLSARSYHKMIKLSRTIADLAGEKEIQKEHLLEALQYRPKRL